MNCFAPIKSRTIKLLDDDIDTDQMIPARFLRTASARGLAPYLFYDKRFTSEGQEVPEFPLSSARYQGETIILAGSNFGCGSSREHAPWALKEFGIQAIISCSFAEIFYNNCLINGILPVQVDADHHQKLRVATQEITICLAEQVLQLDTLRIDFSLDPFARYCLMHGVDELSSIIQCEAAIAQFEQQNRQRIPSLIGL